MHRPTPEQRVQKNSETGCWEWMGALNAYGYGVFNLDKRYWYAHRYFYVQAKGEIPAGFDRDHLCRNRKCCNPEHLEAVDRRTNLLRGDTVTASNAAKDACPRGHAYDTTNTIHRKTRLGGSARFCRQCRRERYVAEKMGMYQEWLRGEFKPDMAEKAAV